MEFSTEQVAELTGTTPRKLTHWDSTGVLKPSGSPARGKGSRRRYTYSDLVAVGVIQRLRDGRCPLPKIRAAVLHLRKHHPEVGASEAIAKLTLATDGRDVILVSDGHQLMEVVSRQFAWWFVPVGQVILSTAKQVEAVRLEWSESAEVLGRRYELVVSREPGGHEFVVRCRDLPGVLQRAGSEAEAVAAGRAAVAEVVAHVARIQRRGRTG